MPILAAVLKGLFVWTVGLFGTWFSKRVAVGLAVAGLFVTLTVGLVAALTAAAAGLSLAAPDIVQRAACWFLPDNTSTCIAAVMGAYGTRFIYDAGVAKVQLAFRF